MVAREMLMPKYYCDNKVKYGSLFQASLLNPQIDKTFFLICNKRIPFDTDDSIQNGLNKNAWT